MGTPVLPNSDQFPDQFQAITFGGGETPTSAKLNVVTGSALTQFQITAIGMGNTFIHGIPNLSAALAGGQSNSSAQGAYSNLTTFVNPAGNIASIPVMFTPSSQSVNQISCVVGPQNGDGSWPVTLTNGQLTQAHHVVGSGSSFNVINIVIARLAGGVMTDIHYGIFVPTSYSGSGPVTTFKAFTDLQQASTGTYVVLAANVSLVDALVQAIQNIGNVTYPSQTARINPVNDQLVDNETFGATLSSEVGTIESKLITARWHAIVNKNSGTVNGTTISWAVTAANNTAFAGGFPAPAVISGLISSLGSGLTTGDTTRLQLFASFQGAPIFASGGSLAVVTLGYSGTTLTLTMNLSDLLAIGNASNFDIYYPMKVPLICLQSFNLSYDLEGIMPAQTFQNVIGSQYAWTSLPYPNTIANRLTALEGLPVAFGANVQTYTANGTFTTGPQMKYIIATLIGGGGGGGAGSANNTTGTFNCSGAGGGASSVVRAIVPVTPLTTYTITIGGGGSGGTRPNNNSGTSGGNGTDGGNTILSLGATTILSAGGGIGGQGGIGGAPVASTGGVNGSANTGSLPPVQIILNLSGLLSGGVNAQQSGGNGSVGGGSDSANAPGGGSILLSGNPNIFVSGGAGALAGSGHPGAQPGSFPGCGGGAGAGGNFGIPGAAGGNGIAYIEW